MKKYNVSGKLFLTLSFVFFSLLGSAQKDRSELEAQRKALESQIKSTTDILAKTQKSKTKTVNQLKALNAGRLSSRKKVKRKPPWLSSRPSQGFHMHSGLLISAVSFNLVGFISLVRNP